MRVGNQAVLQELAERIDQADAVVIGGGSGLSSAAGYDHYHCFSNYGEQWGYYSQYIRFMWEAPTGKPYLDLQALVADKPAFVLTTIMHVLIERHLIVRSICGDAACICKEIWRKLWLLSGRCDPSQQT